MSELNRSLARRWFEEAWNQRRSETIDELLSPEAIGHLESGDVPGIEPFKRLQAEFLAAIPDIRIDIEGIVSDGDDVVVRWNATGTHTGDGLALEPSHQAVSFRGMTWHRFQDGKLVEGWDCWNQEGLLQKLREGPEERRARSQAKCAEISARIREIREERYGEHGGPELARLLGIPARTMYGYETGVAVPADILLKIIDLTGVRPAWLLRGEGPKYLSGPTRS